MNGNYSYRDRQSVPNTGEILFEEYCNSKGISFTHLGFEEKHNTIPNSYKINPFLRNLPDYLVVAKDKLFLVMVKGTANIKKKEVDMIPLFAEWFASKEVPLYYAFCFKEQNTPYFRTPDQVIELYQKAEVDKRWTDGIIYRTLKIEKSSERTL